MKLKVFLSTTVLTATSLLMLGGAQAQSQRSLTPQDSRVAIGFEIRIPGPGGSSATVESDSPQSSPQQTPATQSFQGFSGKSSTYADTYNGFKVKIPAEFTLRDKGLTTDWTGPNVDGAVTTIYVNAAELKGVPSQTVYEINFKSKKEDRQYTDIKPVKIKYGNKTVPGFWCKEANNKPGTPDLKAADEIHRWHLYVFGNQRVYTWGFTGRFSAFQSNQVQKMFEEVIKSVELVPAV